MKVVFLSEKYLTQVSLGSYISGKYCIKIQTEENKKQEIGFIRGTQNQWLFYLNDHIQALENSPWILKENMLRKFCLKETKENVLCYIETQEKETSTYSFYEWKDEIKIGRHKSSDISIAHPFCSAHHAVMKKEGNRLCIEDLNSSNGVYVNQQRMDVKELMLGDVIFIAGITIVIGSGYLAVCNSRLLQVHLVLFQYKKIDPKAKELKPSSFYFPCLRSEPCEIELLPPPPLKEKELMPLLYTMGPALTMAAATCCSIYFQLQKAWKEPELFDQMIPTLSMSIALLGGTLLWPLLQRIFDRKRNQKMEHKRKDAYISYLHKKEEEIKQKQTAEKEIRNQCSFSVNGWMNLLKQGNTGILYPRHPMFLKLQIGRWDSKFHILWKTSDHDTLNKDELHVLYQTFLKQQRFLKNVPYICDLSKDFVIGINTLQKGVIDCFLLQLAVLHQSRNVRIILFGNEEQIKPYRWIPHIRKNSRYVDMICTEEDERQISNELTKLFESRQNKDCLIQHIVLISINRNISNLNIIQKIQDHEYRGFSYLCFCRTKQDCLLNTHLLFDIKELSCKVYCRSGACHSIQLEDPLSDVSSAVVMLSSQRKEETPISLPKRISLLDLYECQSVEELNIISRWTLPYQRNSLQAPLGIKQNRKLICLDLHEAAHGPHGILAGTTGSGKSELILTFLTSLAIQYPPERIVFVLIDFKGGSMAKALQGLPHIAGVLTNLNQNEVDRTLISLQAEVTKRQRIFQKTAQKTQIMNIDIDTYQSLYMDKKVEIALPHIVLVCDEFAELKMQYPQVMSALISFARIGRSLGVHLLLATQKPYGIIDDQIWGNSRFHICLRVAQSEDSMDVLKKPDAVHLEGAGRFYFQVGHDEIFEQGLAAYAGWPYDPTRKTYEEETAEIIDIRGRTIHQTELSYHHDSMMNDTELDVIIRHIQECADRLKTKTEVIWQSLLPQHLSYDESKIWMKKDHSNQILIGLCDVPHRQTYEPLLFDLFHTALCAGEVCDREMLLDTLLREIEFHSAFDITTYIFDFEEGRLVQYQNLYHVAAVFLPKEQERIHIFWDLLYEKIKRKEKQENIFIIIHHYALWKELFEDIEEKLLYIVREGAKLKVHFLFTIAHSSQLPYRLYAAVDDTYVFHMKDKDEYRNLLQEDVSVSAAEKGRGYVRTDCVRAMQMMHLPNQLEKRNRSHKVMRFPMMPAHVYAENIRNQHLLIGISLKNLQPYYQELKFIWFLYAGQLPHAFYHALLASDEFLILDNDMNLQELKSTIKSITINSYLIIKGGEALIHMLGEEVYQNLLNQLASNKIPCIFLEHYQTVFHHVYHNIFHKDDFFWIGAGLQEEGYQVIQDYVKDVDNKSDNAYGYHIKQGTAHKLLLIEKEE